MRVKRWHGVAIWKWDIADEEVVLAFFQLNVLKVGRIF